ncbi:MAG: type IV toxin-antitoxin system AbiEi family antitoxin domain-containing protein [Deltaproteobacteria bacterium]|nr:type IV toxin-antitoxin system AbiEi family antitoxin domain-containing protein [Deltaproteobacteria bacterium]
MKNAIDKFKKFRRIFHDNNGILRTSVALKAGIHPRTLYAMRDSGILEQLARGLYRLSDMSPMSNPDLQSVAMKIPSGVICLISALAYHELTTQIPHVIYLALPRKARQPKLTYPPTQIFRFTGRSFSEGIETEKIDGISVRIYCPEKTIADCFKYRNKIGLETAIEALRTYRRRKIIKANELMQYARICRVEKVMRPYLEAIL